MSIIKELKDPEIDVIRDPFLETISRLCLLLALGHFLCVIPFYIILGASEVTKSLFFQYCSVVTFVGCLFTVLGVVARSQFLKRYLGLICISILFIEPC